MIQPISYKRHRFPPEIIAHAVWLYFRFPLSLRLVEEMPWSAASSSPMRPSGDGP
jgi:transposase-like protein